MDILKITYHNHLPLRLSPIEYEELYVMEESCSDFYTYQDGLITLRLPKKSKITDSLRKELLKTPLYFEKEEKQKLIRHYQDILLRLTRSISMGNLNKNVEEITKFLLINLHYLYQEPENDQLLSNGYNCLKNIARVLIDQNISTAIYQNVSNLPFHYTITHPLLSSLFILEYSKELKMFSKNDLESIFILNFFKDIGMFNLPRSTLNATKLTLSEKKLIAGHEERSFQILKSRIPLTGHHLNIIKNHHLNSNIAPIINDKKNIFGFETILISVGDSFTSMTLGRPYRKKIPFYDTLRFNQELMGKEHNQEFKLLIKFVQKFF